MGSGCSANKPEPTDNTPAQAQTPSADPAPTSVEIGGKTYKYVDGPPLGDGIWAIVKLATDASGHQVAVKELTKKTEEQEKELVLECRLHEFVYKMGAQATGDSSRAMVPQLYAYTGHNAAIEYMPAKPLEHFLRGDYKGKPRPMEAADIAMREKVCWVALKKVFTLLEACKAYELSHRDMNDGNVVVDVKLGGGAEDGATPSVSSSDDIGVWLFDFGKSMALIDGEKVSGGMGGAYSYNPTTDTVRFMMNVQQSLIRAYTGDKDTKPEGELRTWLESHMPFREQFAAFLAHAIAIGKEQDWLGGCQKAVDEAEAKVAETEEGSEARQKAEKKLKFATGDLKQVGAVLDGMHFLDFCTKPSFVFLRKYYTLSEEAQWCPRVMPSTLLAECPL